MKEIGLEELKAHSLDILKGVHDFCKTHNLRYSLSDGTLIGAVRHKGFIPWDDDIDMVMPRPDYNQFIKTFNQENDFFKVIAPEINADYYVPYANVYDTRTKLIEDNISHRGFELGVKIDIFPLDGVPDDFNDYKKQTRRIGFINRILSAKRHSLGYYFPRSIIKTIAVIFTRALYIFVPYRKLQKELHRIAVYRDYESAYYVDNLVYPSYNNTRHKKSCYSNFIEVQFEQYTFMIASGYDEILTTIYGDYMKLPPEEERVPLHNFNAWWK